MIRLILSAGKVCLALFVTTYALIWIGAGMGV